MTSTSFFSFLCGEDLRSGGVGGSDRGDGDCGGGDVGGGGHVSF